MYQGGGYWWRPLNERQCRVNDDREIEKERNGASEKKAKVAFFEFNIPFAAHFVDSISSASVSLSLWAIGIRASFTISLSTIPIAQYSHTKEGSLFLFIFIVQIKLVKMCVFLVHTKRHQTVFVRRHLQFTEATLSKTQDWTKKSSIFWSFSSIKHTAHFQCINITAFSIWFILIGFVIFFFAVIQKQIEKKEWKKVKTNTRKNYDQNTVWQQSDWI